MDWQFTLESFDSLSPFWKKLQDESQTSYIFSLPEWSRIWWQQFGIDTRLYLGAIKYQQKIVGIAPLLIKESIASFIGSANVCDYLDFIVDTNHREASFVILLDNLEREGITRMDLAPLRPDSIVLTDLVNIARGHGWQVSCQEEDTSVEFNLPDTWEKYLQSLIPKQRHELKRKLRRLAEAGEINYRISTDANLLDVNTFLRLFQESSQDKAAFLTPEMESFFRSLVSNMSEQKFLELSILELNAIPVAATMCFDYKNDVYLYNSGYDPEYSWLSVGLISKALCIKNSIEGGKKRFDFLKGSEKYKYHLGGHGLPIYKCSIISTL